MLTVDDLINKLQLELLTEIDNQREISITGCYIGDLLSNVMAQAKPGNLWLTVMNNPNIIAIAQLLDIAAIVILEGHQPMIETLKKAKIEKTILLSSQDSAYTLACRINELIKK